MQRHRRLNLIQTLGPDAGYRDDCRIEDNFIRRSNALDDFDRGAEVAADFDVAELDAVIGFHDSDLQSLGAEQQGIVRQSNNLP
jgi:hypothetical protein